MKSLMFASLAVVAVLLGSASAAQAQHYEQRRPAYGHDHGGYNSSRHIPQHNQHYQPSPTYRLDYGHIDRHAPVYSPPVHVHRPHYPVYQAPPVCAPTYRYEGHGHRSSRW